VISNNAQMLGLDQVFRAVADPALANAEKPAHHT